MKAIRVLIVEDEVIIRKYVISILKKIGCEIIGETSTGEDAVDLTMKNPPDLVLMDIKLDGEMDGIEAAKIISSISDASIAFMSAYDYEEKVKKEKIGNCIAFLNKPVERHNLDRVVKKIH